jgi:hypothetical protein
MWRGRAGVVDRPTEQADAESLCGSDNGGDARWSRADRRQHFASDGRAAYQRLDNARSWPDTRFREYAATRFCFVPGQWNRDPTWIEQIVGAN